VLLSLRRGFDHHRFAGIMEKGVAVFEGTTQPAGGLSKASDLQLIGELVVRQWMTERTSGTDDERRDGEAQIARVRRGARMVLGLPAESAVIANADPQTLAAPPLTNHRASPSQAKKPRVPRPRLAKSIEREWKTEAGMVRLLSASMRELKGYFSVKSHASFYDVPLFNEKIRPLREKRRLDKQAGQWVERLARAR
jgi:hypothetical protein